ncbi:MAG: phage major capsid protein [Nitrococcus sp.]|nr:phage major capsid protein [Nitrococcus sp.]
MSPLNELRQRQHDLKADGRALLEAIRAENRDPSDAEEARLAEMERALEALGADIERAEKQLSRASLMALPARAPMTGGVPVAASAGFDSLAEFAIAVKDACHPGGLGAPDARLAAMYQAAPTNFHQEGGSADGYMVPAQFREEISTLVFSEPDLLTLVSPEPTSSNQVELLADETTPWGSTGVQANWRAEGAQMSPSRLETEGRAVKLHELYAYVLATEELMQDAPRLNARLTTQAARAIRWKASEAIVNGTGVGQPLGYFVSGALVSVAKETSQAADTINATNVAKMYSRNLNPGRALWLANSDTLPQLMTMTISNQPIWTPPNAGFAQAPGGMLLGRPIILSEHADTVGDKGDIHFIDPMGYYAATKRGGIAFASSIHLYFDYGVQAFRWTFRFGGQPFLSAPVSGDKSANTKSHFVVLDARA